jgi:hypothetical protein
MIVLNGNALEQRIQNNVEKAINKIKENAEKGIAITDVLFEKDIFIQCRTKLNEFCKENKVNFSWIDLGGYMSLDYGTHRLMKFRIKD